jgi:hypothetical protein
MTRYKHTQFGWVIVLILLLTGAIVIVAAFSNQETKHLKESLLLGAFIIFTLLLLFYSLTTEVTDEDVKVSFGSGLIRKTISLHEIESCTVKRNQLVLGWGIRLGMNFTLWNVSGFDSVELTFRDKKWKFRVGTDQPQELCDAIIAAITARSH